jgi:predicted DCC family thiol-disulfide oxidoreductase YuxK
MRHDVRAYDYRLNQDVPGFPDDKPIIVFDGHCALCSGWVRFVIRHDRSARYRFLSAQSDIGQAIYAHYGMDTRDFSSNILIEDGLPHLRMDGTVRMAAGLGFPWTIAKAIRILPTIAQDAMYRLVARNRYRIFGRLDACMRPDPAHAERFIA